MTRRTLLILALLTAADCAVAERVQLEKAAVLRPDGLAATGETRLAVDMAALDRIRGTSATFELELPVAADQMLLLRLKRFDVITPGTRFVVGPDARPMPVPEVVLLRGEIAGEPGSHAFLALTPQGVGNGRIVRTSGEAIQLTPARGDGKASGLVVRHGTMRPQDPGIDAVCGTIDARLPPPSDGIAGDPLPPEPARGVRVLTVAIDADQSFTELFTSLEDAQSYIVQLIGAVSDIFMRDLDLKLALGFVRLWPEGGEPFGADDLFGFRDYWTKNEDLTGLNLVHLLSGRRDLGYGGIAFLADGCSEDAFAISGFLLGGFPTPVDAPDLDNWDVIVVAHEMGHNLSTPHTHSFDPPIDQCGSVGTNERGTIMSYCHTRMGGLLNIDMRFHSGCIDFIAANNPAGKCLWHDCNGNGIDDAEDVAIRSSADANANAIPDECEDCDGNGELDPADIASGAASDVNVNGIPDSCEDDCNANGTPDRWDIALGAAEDANGNRIPDECEADCDSNGIADHRDISEGLAIDLDRNSAPDGCQDCNHNGLPDWMDVERQNNVYIGQSSAWVREYHAASGVLIQGFGSSAIDTSYDLAFGPDRQLYVASFNDHRIIRLDVDTGQPSDFVTPGSGGLARPSALTFGPDGHLYVASATASRVLKFDGASGAPLGLFVSNLNGALASPWDLAFGPNGNLFVSSGTNNSVVEYDGLTGGFVRIFADGLDGLNGPRGLAFVANGDLLVANRLGNNVTRYDPDGNLLGQFNDYGLTVPWGITVGPNGNPFVVTGSGTVRGVEFDWQTGRYLRSFIRGDELLTAPTQIAFRPPSANDVNGNGIPDECDAATCRADISPVLGSGDGQVGLDDLLLVIDSWGPCPSCPADISPSRPDVGDGIVDVNDLLAVISAWGPCP